MKWQSTMTLARLQRWLLQYAVAVLIMLIAVKALFPGNRFLPVPWHHDDFNNLAASYHYGRMPFSVLVARPVSTNFIWLLGARGETAFYLTMLALAAAIPVLAVRLGLRLFHLRVGARSVLAMVACVTLGTFAFEHSLQYYRYTGMMTNLVSVVTGLLAAGLLADAIQGRRSPAWGILCALLSGFAKEDMLLFVPAFAVLYAWLEAARSGQPLLTRRLGTVVLGLLLVGGAVFVWNSRVVASPFTTGADPAYRLKLSPSAVASQCFQYAAASPVATRIFLAYLALLALGLSVKGHRVAVLASAILVGALMAPYLVLPRFFEYYSLNWLSALLAFTVAGLTATCQAWCPQSWKTYGITTLLPVGALIAALLSSPAASALRGSITEWFNVQQLDNQYVIAEVVRHREEFAGCNPVALRGVDDVYSAWMKTDGAYINLQVGRPIHWLLIARPGTFAAQYMQRHPYRQGNVSLVFEEDLAQFPPLTTLQFDKNLNLRVIPARGNQERHANTPSANRR
jgi:hypothetical protein